MTGDKVGYDLTSLFSKFEIMGVIAHSFNNISILFLYAKSDWGFGETIGIYIVIGAELAFLYQMTFDFAYGFSFDFLL